MSKKQAGSSGELEPQPQPGALPKHVESKGLQYNDALPHVDSEDIVVVGQPMTHLPGDDSPLFPDYESRCSISTELPYEDREKWSNKMEFILSCISMSVGLGNVWRFPFAALENGGGAFLIPYFIFLFVIAKPISVLDMSFGQFSSRGPVTIWDVVPAMRGVGFCTLIVAGATLTYICAILSFCVIYLYRGLAHNLPWAGCDPNLYVKRKFIENLTCVLDPALQLHVVNESTVKYYKSNSELYFQYAIVKQLENVDDGIGLPDPSIVLCLGIVWFLMFIQFSAGTKSTGKCSYFTALFPHLVLITLLVRASLLDGALHGVIYFFKPQWELIFTFRVWRNALSQAFFSLAVGYGTMIYGSYNPFRQHIKTEALIVGCTDGFTSLLAGVTVFAVLGVLAHRKGISLSHLARGDMGLAFVTYPEVLTYFGPWPMPQIFSFIFFAMLLTLGVGSSAGYLHPIIASIFDLFPSVAKSRPRKMAVTFLVTLVGFLVGIVYTTPGGIFIIHLVDEFLTGIVLYVSVCCELVAIFWFYGVQNYIQDMEFMLNAKCPAIIRNWCYFIPFFMLAVGIYTIIDFELGYGAASMVVLIIPVGILFVFFTRRTRSCSKKFKASFYPNRKWGPKSPEIRKEWEAYKKSFYNKSPTSLYQITVGRLVRRKKLRAMLGEEAGGDVPPDDVGTDTAENVFVVSSQEVLRHQPSVFGVRVGTTPPDDVLTGQGDPPPRK